jgi:DNA-binding transcriptional MerR regulator
MDQLEPIMNLTLSRHEVFDILRDTVKATEREISYWTDLEIVIPDIANPKSQGKTRFYSLLNVVDFAVVKTLSEAGLKLKFIKKVMDFLRCDRESRFEFYFGPFTYRLIILDQNTDRMKIMMEIKRVPKEFPTHWPDGKSEDQIIADVKQIPLKISEPFDTLFAFDARSMVKKIRNSMR